MVFFGFFGFAKGAYDSVNNFGLGIEDNFNPFPYMILGLLGALISGISSYALYGGLSIFVASVATNYLDTRNKCPKCDDIIDEDEKVCSNCGYKIDSENVICECGKINQPTDKFCRECGKILN